MLSGYPPPSRGARPALLPFSEPRRHSQGRFRVKRSRLLLNRFDIAGAPAVDERAYRSSFRHLGIRDRV